MYIKMSTEKVFNTLSHFFMICITAIGKFLKIAKNFFKENIEITSSKKSKITGAIVTGVLLLTVIIFNGRFTKLVSDARWWLLAFALIAPFIIGLYIAYNIKLKYRSVDKFWHFILFFLMPIVTITMTECLNNIFIYDMTYLGFYANYVVILLFQFWLGFYIWFFARYYYSQYNH